MLARRHIDSIDPAIGYLKTGFPNVCDARWGWLRRILAGEQGQKGVTHDIMAFVKPDAWFRTINTPKSSENYAIDTSATSYLYSFNL